MHMHMKYLTHLIVNKHVRMHKNCLTCTPTNSTLLPPEPRVLKESSFEIEMLSKLFAAVSLEIIAVSWLSSFLESVETVPLGPGVSMGKSFMKIKQRCVLCMCNRVAINKIYKITVSI